MGAGTDTLSGLENLLGSAFNDTLTGSTAGNRIDGGAGGDAMAGGAGNDTYRVDTSLTQRLVMVNGNQTLVSGGFVADTVSEAAGGGGTDTVETYVSFALPDNVENLTALEFIFSPTSGYYNPPSMTLTGNGLDNLIVDNRGSNTIDGGAGMDTVSFQNATASVNVTLGQYYNSANGGSGSDQLTSIENIIGSAYNDTMTIDGIGNRYDGGAGVDTLSYDNLPSSGYPDYTQPGIVVSLALTGAQNTVGAGTDTILNFENLTGADGNDRLTGNAQDNVLIGGNGNDTLEGAGGNDTLRGWTESTSSSSSGDTGTDTVSYAGAAAGVTVNLSLAGAQNTGGAGIDTLSGFENLAGSAFNDSLTGDTGANRLDGGVGNDVLNGGAGDDTLSGGGGNDTLNGGAGVDTALYFNAAAGVSVNLGLATSQNTVGAGSDLLTGIENLQGSAFNDTLIGDAANNVLEGLGGNDVLSGGAGVDTASYAGAAAAIRVNLGLTTAQNTLGAGTDTLSGFENLLGSAFNDTLTGSTAGNRIDGGAGGDAMAGGAGNDSYRVETSVTQRLVMVNGNQTLESGSFVADTVSEAAGGGTDTVETYVSFALADNVENLTALEFIQSTSGYYNPPSLTLTGNGLDNLIVDNRGGNTIDGGAGMDTVSFQNAISSVDVSLSQYGSANGGSGYDQLRNIENIIGSAYNDTITVNGLGDRYDGGAGIDTLSYANLPNSGYPDYTQPGIDVSLALTGAQNTVGAGTDTILNFENLTGADGHDRLTGNALDNVLIGGDGNDTLEGAGGNDTLRGWTESTYGQDTGTDTASYAGAAAGVTINLSLVGAQNTGGAGIDTLSGFENLTGSAFNDTLTGDPGANVLAGGAGNDVLNGGAGDDVLNGGAGADTLSGGAGLDTADYGAATAAVAVDLGLGGVSGGAGNDTLSGIETLVGSAFNDTLTG